MATTKRGKTQAKDQILGAIRMHDGETLEPGDEERLKDLADTLSERDFRRLRKEGVIVGFKGLGSADEKARLEAIANLSNDEDEDEEDELAEEDDGEQPTDEEPGTGDDSPAARAARQGLEVGTNPDGSIANIRTGADDDDEEEEEAAGRGGAKRGGAKKTTARKGGAKGR